VPVILHLIVAGTTLALHSLVAALAHVAETDAAQDP
jgi:hypothetical protein